MIQETVIEKVCKYKVLGNLLILGKIRMGEKEARGIFDHFLPISTGSGVWLVNVQIILRAIQLLARRFIFRGLTTTATLLPVIYLSKLVLTPPFSCGVFFKLHIAWLFCGRATS